MSNGGEHGALGSNAPLARVPVEQDVPAEKENVPAEKEKEEVISDVPVATSSATEDDGDVVYLRDDLRRVAR